MGNSDPIRKRNGPNQRRQGTLASSRPCCGTFGPGHNRIMKVRVPPVSWLVIGIPIAGWLSIVLSLNALAALREFYQGRPYSSHYVELIVPPLGVLTAFIFPVLVIIFCIDKWLQTRDRSRNKVSDPESTVR
jgi:hypothetical protein